MLCYEVSLAHVILSWQADKRDSSVTGWLCHAKIFKLLPA